MKTLVLGFVLAAAGCSSSTTQPSATTSSGAGGICKEQTAEHCLDVAIGSFEVDKDAANVIAEYLCAGEFGAATRQACTLAGHVYRTGAAQTKPDAAKARARYERGCPLDAKDAESGSCFRLGLVYGKGKLTLTDAATFPIDKPKGKQYLDLACTKGFRDACTVAATL